MTKMIINNMNMMRESISKGDIWDVHGSGLAGETPLFWVKSLFLSTEGEGREKWKW
jgi:hypothetical protein